MIVSSSDIGVRKLNLEIFEYALRKAHCLPHEAIMIGDRIDNDIMPATQIGMKTVWVKQGYAHLVDQTTVQPDYIITKIEDILEIDFSKL